MAREPRRPDCSHRNLGSSLPADAKAGYNPWMQPFRFALADLLLLSGAAPMWVWLMVKVPSATAWGVNPFRYMVPPFALLGLMIIFYLALSPWRHAWSAAALLASVCGTAGLFLLVAFAT